jgi:putative transposase
VRTWWNRFGPVFTAEIRKHRIQGPLFSRWRWNQDEVFVRINGEQHYLWRAVDQEGEVLESFVTKRRNRRAGLKFLRKAMKRYGRPEVIVMDLPRSYRGAMKIIGNVGRQETGRRKNNRAVNSHQPFLRRERAMAKFRSTQSLQKFTSTHASVHDHFNQDRHLHSCRNFKVNRSTALAEWRQIAA